MQKIIFIIIVVFLGFKFLMPESDEIKPKTSVSSHQVESTPQIEKNTQATLAPELQDSLNDDFLDRGLKTAQERMKNQPILGADTLVPVSPEFYEQSGAKIPKYKQDIIKAKNDRIAAEKKFKECLKYRGSKELGIY